MSLSESRQSRKRTTVFGVSTAPSAVSLNTLVTRPGTGNSAGGTKKPQKKVDVESLVKQHKDTKEAHGETYDSDDENAPARPFVDWVSFDITVSCLIVADAIVMGIGVDAGGGGAWYGLEVVFLVTFAVELVLRIFFHGMRFFTSPRDKGVNRLDFCVVLAALLDAFVFAPMGNPTVLRFAVFLRFVRAFGIVRIARGPLAALHVDRLWVVGSGLLEAAKTLLWVCVVLFVLLYIGGVFTTILIGKRDDIYDPYFRESRVWDHEEYFGTVPRSMFTLFQMVTLDNWSDSIARHVAVEQPAMIAFFICFIAICTFGLLNLIVSIIIESILTRNRKEAERADKAKSRERSKVFGDLRYVFEEADADESGLLTLEEMTDAIANQEIYQKLKMIDFPVDDPEKIFMLLDYDESGELSIDEFITGCIRMRGSANSKDLLVAQVAVDTMKRRYDSFESEMERCQKKIKKLQVTAKALISQGEHVFLDPGEFRRRHEEMGGSEAFIPAMKTCEFLGLPWEEDSEEEEDESESGSEYHGGTEMGHLQGALNMGFDRSHGSLPGLIE